MQAPETHAAIVLQLFCEGRHAEIRKTSWKRLNVSHSSNGGRTMQDYGTPFSFLYRRHVRGLKTMGAPLRRGKPSSPSSSSIHQSTGKRKAELLLQVQVKQPNERVKALFALTALFRHADLKMYEKEKFRYLIKAFFSPDWFRTFQTPSQVSSPRKAQWRKLWTPTPGSMSVLLKRRHRTTPK